MDVQEVRKLDTYLGVACSATPRSVRCCGPRRSDSAEVYIGEEFIGVLFVDDE